MTDPQAIRAAALREAADARPEAYAVYGADRTDNYAKGYCAGVEAYRTAILALIDQTPEPTLDTCPNCAGTGTAGHPDSGYTCWDCDGSGGVAAEAAQIPTSKQQKAQGERCTCKGSDEYCPCQNVVYRSALESAAKTADEWYYNNGKRTPGDEIRAMAELQRLGQEWDQAPEPVPQGVADICHEDQMTVWSNELMMDLSEYFDFATYDDKIDADSTIKSFIHHIVKHALTTAPVSTAEAALVMLPLAQDRKLPCYILEMPLDAEDRGPATIGEGAVSMAYEVMTADMQSLSIHNLLSDAVPAWLRALSEQKP